MSPQIFITGSIQCGKSTLVRSIFTELQIIYSGYYSQKKWNSPKNQLEIWLYDFLSDLSVCFATQKENREFVTDLKQFDSFLRRIIFSNKICNSQIFCIDEIGFLEKDSKILEEFIHTLPNFKIPIILVVQKRVSANIQQYLQSSSWRIYDLDLIDPDAAREKIISLLKT